MSNRVVRNSTGYGLSSAVYALLFEHFRARIDTIVP